LRPAWEDRLPDLWGVTVEAPDRTSNAFFRVSEGRIAVPAGFDQAARELRELGPLDGQPWGGGLIYMVMSAGGTTPGFPDTWSSEEAPLPDGGMRITVEMTEAEVAYAVAGGVGPAPPSAFSGRGGETPFPRMATATLDITEDYALQWRYQLGGDEIDGPSGTPAESTPSFSDEQLVALLDGARLRARAPRAIPVAEPQTSSDDADVVVVDLWALGPVYVRLGRAVAPELDPSAPISTLVLLLSAADALPPGILPTDLLDTAEVRAGELTAPVPAPLAAWAAGGARRPSPRVTGVKTAEEMAQQGRIRISLDDPARYSLEVREGDSWRPADGEGP
jgi:hypothetical protein